MGRHENELLTPWRATPADHHDHEHSGTPQLYHRGRDQPTFTTALHYTWTNQGTTNQRRHEHADYMSRI